MTAKNEDPEMGKAEVEAYMARTPEPAGGMLKKMRAIIRGATPKGATECMSYRMPAFYFKGVLVSYGAFKNHCSLFPMGWSVLEGMAGELEGYRVSKGTIHFGLEKPLPEALIRKIVKACVARNEGKAKG